MFGENYQMRQDTRITNEKIYFPDIEPYHYCSDSRATLGAVALRRTRYFKKVTLKAVHIHGILIPERTNPPTERLRR